MTKSINGAKAEYCSPGGRGTEE